MIWQRGAGRITFSNNQTASNLIERIVAASREIGEFFNVRSGLQAYERGRGSPPQTESDVKEHVFDRKDREDENSYRYLQGGDVQRFTLHWTGMWMQYGEWLAQPRDLSIFTRPRVLIREITSRPPRCLSSVFTAEEYLSNKSVLTILHNDDAVDWLVLLNGILNSRIMSLYYVERAVKGSRKIFPKVVIKNVREFPFPEIRSDELVTSVAQRVRGILELHTQLKNAKTSHAQMAIQRQIDATDRKIDQLVYALYDLTEEEIAIVEAATE
jgi:hypothetical protein